MKKRLGVFVNTPFTKLKEILNGHEQQKLHPLCTERAGIIGSQMANVESRIPVQIIYDGECPQK